MGKGREGIKGALPPQLTGLGGEDDLTLVGGGAQSKGDELHQHLSKQAVAASWKSVVQTAWLTSGRKQVLGSSPEAPDPLGKLAAATSPVGCGGQNDNPIHKGSTS